MKRARCSLRPSPGLHTIQVSYSATAQGRDAQRTTYNARRTRCQIPWRYASVASRPRPGLPSAIQLCGCHPMQSRRARSTVSRVSVLASYRPPPSCIVPHACKPKLANPHPGPKLAAAWDVGAGPWFSGPSLGTRGTWTGSESASSNQAAEGCGKDGSGGLLFSTYNWCVVVPARWP